MEDRALVVFTSRGVHSHGGSSLRQGINRCKRWKIPGMYRSYQVSQEERWGPQQDVQGIVDGLVSQITVTQLSPQKFCREVIAWKHLSHPNILPLLGVSISADTRCLCILTEWMPNGNVMQYAISNPEENRLQLVRPLGISTRPVSCSSVDRSFPRSRLPSPIFTTSRLFMGI